MFCFESVNNENQTLQMPKWKQSEFDKWKVFFTLLLGNLHRCWFFFKPENFRLLLLYEFLPIGLNVVQAIWYPNETSVAWIAAAMTDWYVWHYFSNHFNLIMYFFKKYARKWVYALTVETDFIAYNVCRETSKHTHTHTPIWKFMLQDSFFYIFII